MLRYLLYSVRFVVYWFSRALFCLVPKKKSLWVFGGWEGQSFCDNSKYLFLHIRKNHPEVEILWLSWNQTLVQEMTIQGFPAAHVLSLKGVWSQIRAGAYFVSHGPGDLCPFLLSNNFYCELYHATFPLKKMGFDAEAFNPKSLLMKCARRIRDPHNYLSPDFSMASSPTVAGVLATALNMPIKELELTGFPRTDALVENLTLPSDQEKIERLWPSTRQDKIIYYVPTFRNDPKFSFFDFEFNLNALGEFLERHNAVMVFRLHPFDLHKISQLEGLKHPRLIFENHKLSDPYPFLKRVSVLITDFSSIYADYLVLDRPIVFANFAHQSYVNKERPLYWNYDDVTPGEKAANWPQLLAALESALSSDPFRSQRAALSAKIYSLPFDGNSERVYQAVRRRLKLGT